MESCLLTCCWWKKHQQRQAETFAKIEHQQRHKIICPQQGIWINNIGAFNVEITVTGQRGWVDENTKELAADMSVEGKIWFSPSTKLSIIGEVFWSFFSRNSNLPFPVDKANAIRVNTHLSGNPNQPIFQIRDGHTTLFKSPDFAIHNDAWTVGNIEVEIGDIQTTGSTVVDEFNQLVMSVFNLASGNMLQNGNLLTWNLWFKEPALVDIEEWKNHAKRWRDSIDEDHGSPTGPGTTPKFFDGTELKPIEVAIDEGITEFLKWIYYHSKR